MIDTTTIQTMLRALGIAIRDDEAEGLSLSLVGILADLRKLDELEKEEAEPTPGFTVEKQNDRS